MFLVAGVTFVNCAATAVRVTGGTVATFIGCSFSRNSGPDAAAVYIQGSSSTVSFTDCSFTDNKSPAGGGGATRCQERGRTKTGVVAALWLLMGTAGRVPWVRRRGGAVRVGGCWLLRCDGGILPAWPHKWRCTTVLCTPPPPPPPPHTHMPPMLPWDAHTHAGTVVVDSGATVPLISGCTFSGNQLGPALSCATPDFTGMVANVSGTTFSNNGGWDVAKGGAVLLSRLPTNAQNLITFDNVRFINNTATKGKGRAGRSRRGLACAGLLACRCRQERSGVHHCHLEQGGDNG